MALLSTVWDKIYKRDFLLKHNIEFIKELKTSEDGIFNLFCIFNIPKIAFTEEHLYNYLYTRPGSATSDLKLKTEIETFKYLLNSYLFQNAERNLKILALEKSLFTLNSWFRNAKHETEQEKQKYMQIFFDYLNSNVDKSYLKECISFEELTQILKGTNFLEKIFSIKDLYINIKKKRIIHILGIKLTLKI